MRPLNQIAVWHQVDKALFENEIKPLGQPAVLKGLVKKWPLVEIATESNASLLQYLTKQYKGGLVEAFKNQSTKFLVISFSSDWLYTTKENKDIVIALNTAGADVSYSEIVTDKGHDSFLLNEPEFLKTLKGFVDSMYEKFKK